MLFFVAGLVKRPSVTFLFLKVNGMVVVNYVDLQKAEGVSVKKDRTIFQIYNRPIELELLLRSQKYCTHILDKQKTYKQLL